MSWRVVVVSGMCKLESKLGYLVCRGEEVRKVFLQEIDTLIIESTAVSLTAALLCELIKNKVNVVFCDEKHNPQSQLVALYGRHDGSGCIKKQLCWDDGVKNEVWTEIVRLKIQKQYEHLLSLGLAQADMLANYLLEIKQGDCSNREGHAAKVYFNALFGVAFKRGDSTYVNNALDYGYAILLSAFNRAIVGLGYNTQIGLAHKSEFNMFNLSCDLVEPFRVLVDRHVIGNMAKFDSDYKRYLCDLLNQTVVIGGEKHTVLDAVGIYCKSVFTALDSGDASGIVCYEL